MTDGAAAPLRDITITSLEMRARPKRAGARPPLFKRPVMLLRAERPTLSFYRYLYNTIGRDWCWYERRQMDDNALARIIHDDSVAVYVLYVGGVPAGYVEIDSRRHVSVEIAYLGLMPEFVGRGLGRYLVNWAVDTAWDMNPERVWIHTCNLDHPAALLLYQKVGFTVFNQEKIAIPDPSAMVCFQN
ncbi:MAG: GNAT family N-acetyltransferase [Alphaproteobacteria bacterium]